MFRCPHCRGANQPTAQFCIDCGEPLDEESLAEYAARREAYERIFFTRRPEENGKRLDEEVPEVARGQRVELWLGVMLLAVVLGFVVFSYISQEVEASHYRAAQDAYSKGEYRVARREFLQANGYLESSHLLANTDQQLKNLAGYYEQVQQAVANKEWWNAAHIIVSQDALAKNYNDIPDLLAKARNANGKIVYKLYREDTSDSTKSGLYVAEADGGNPQFITGTTPLSEVLAISPDNRWGVVITKSGNDFNSYSVPVTYTLSLFSLATAHVTELLPPEGAASPVWAYFSDNNTFRLGDDAHVSTFTVSDQVGATLSPATSESAQAYERREYKSLLLSTDGQGHSTLAAAEYDGANPQTISVEQGTIDGALVSRDSRFVVYRVCLAAGTSGAQNCTLKLANLKAPGSLVHSIATVPMRRKNDPNNSIVSEFTGDGKHLLVIEEYQGTSEAHLLSLDEAMEWVQLPDTMLNTDTEGEVISPLLPDYSPGLRFWQGPNSLAHTESAIEAEDTPPGYGKHMHVYQTMSHQVTISPDGRYALYFAPRRSRNRVVYNIRLASLSLVPAEKGNAQPAYPTIGMLSLRDIPAWSSTMMRFLPDGFTLLATMTPARNGPRGGINAIQLDTGELAGEISGPNNARPSLSADNRP